jgi:single-strand DNA-binding protein
MYLNQLTIIGFTGHDADFHFTPNGTSVTTVSVATKESWKTADNEWQNRTDWHRVVAFGKLAEYPKTLAKGTHVMVRARCDRASTRKMAYRIVSSNFVPTPLRNSIVPNVARSENLTPSTAEPIWSLASARLQFSFAMALVCQTGNTK